MWLYTSRTQKAIKELCQFLITERNCPGVSIKPLLTKEQLSIEAILLKERWKLIQSGSSSQLGQCLNNDTFFRRKPSTGTGYLRALDLLHFNARSLVPKLGSKPHALQKHGLTQALQHLLTNILSSAWTGIDTVVVLLCILCYVY